MQASNTCCCHGGRWGRPSDGSYTTVSIRDLTDVPTVRGTQRSRNATTDMGDLKGIITSNLSVAQSLSLLVGREHSVVDPQNTFD